ncbi:MAG: AbrB/MazE/SpoVT family DNA-binding domain-containing protein [Nakamurella sp.]
MRTTIDKAGRLVIPKALRDEVGMIAGEVTISVDGAALRIEVEPPGGLIEREGHLLLPEGSEAMDDARLREFRLADQR